MKRFLVVLSGTALLSLGASGSLQAQRAPDQLFAEQPITIGPKVPRPDCPASGRSHTDAAVQRRAGSAKSGEFCGTLATHASQSGCRLGTSESGLRRREIDQRLDGGPLRLNRVSRCMGPFTSSRRAVRL
jgi:hypothetical protein